jgi:hypothetical protein
VRNSCVFAASAALVAVAGASAQSINFQINPQTSPSTSVGGGISSGEYFGSTTGTGSGFGSMIGAGRTLRTNVNGGNLFFGLEGSGLTGTNVAVIYLDTRAGGIASTSGLTDLGDPGRAAISGRATSNANTQATLNFGSDFRPDFALAFQAGNGSSGGFIGLFEIVSGGRHNFIGVAAQAPVSAGSMEASVSLSNLGITLPGVATVRYMMTLLNAENAFRSNEFQGVGSSPSDNIGQNTFTFGQNQFAQITIIPNPVAALAAAPVLGLLIARRRRVG